jgi:hypothetical protein
MHKLRLLSAGRVAVGNFDVSVGRVSADCAAKPDGNKTADAINIVQTLNHDRTNLTRRKGKGREPKLLNHSKFFVIVKILHQPC